MVQLGHKVTTTLPPRKDLYALYTVAFDLDVEIVHPLQCSSSTLLD